VRGGELSTSVFCRGEKRQQRVVYDVNDIDPITPRVASNAILSGISVLLVRALASRLRAASRWNSVLSQFRNAP
jgi:hypothetical protein